MIPRICNGNAKFNTGSLAVPASVFAILLSHPEIRGFQCFLMILLVIQIWLRFRLEALIRPTLTIYTLEGVNYISIFLSCVCFLIWIYHVSENMSMILV